MVTVKNFNDYITIYNFISDAEARAFILGLKTADNLGDLKSIKLDGKEI